MSQFSSPEELEKVHVRDVYNQIAPRCTSVQYKAWPKVAEFLQSLPTGSVIADVGCGPGKYLGLVPSSFITGSDTCVQFVSTAREKQHEVCVCDNQLLPYRDGCFDAVISVGVIHHFASAKRRLKALRELTRILKPGGQMLVYAWALEQSERKFSGQDVLVPYKGYHRSRGKRRKHICHFASNGEKGREQNGARDKCLCSVISHESLFEDKERHRQAPRSRVSTVQKPRAVSNGSVAEHNQEQIKTIRNGHEGDSTEVRTGATASTSKFGAFVSRVADKLFDSKEPSDYNSVLERSSFVAEIHDKLRKLIPTQADNGGLHSKSILALVSRKIFKRNENGLCAVSVDRNESKPDETSSSTCGDVMSTQIEHRSLHASSYSTGCTLPSSVKETYIDSCASKEVSLSGESTNGIGSRLLARLLETLSSSDTDSDSSSSGDSIGADWSLPDESETSFSCGVPCTKKAFQHTTLCCQEFKVSSSSTNGLNPAACNGSDSAGLCQRYYHVFRQGELVELIQQGVPSLDVVEEYYDHANWAVIAVKG